jgi:hypothetical protein
LLARLFWDHYLPDLLHAALCAAFFLFVARGQSVLAIVMLFTMHLARESTILVSVIFAAVCFWRKEIRLGLGAVAVIVLGSIVSSAAGKLGMPNIHQIGGFSYMALKVPFNFLKNFCGLDLWTNTLAARLPDYYTKTPERIFQIPAWLHAGNIHQVGLYAFLPGKLQITYGTLLTVFGVLPAVVLKLLRRSPGLIGSMPVFCLTAFIYGIICFITGPALGASVSRLVGYGWPCFWIALPFLYAARTRLDRKAFIVLCCCQAAACWGMRGLEIVGCPFLLAICPPVAAQVVAYRTVTIKTA